MPGQTDIVILGAGVMGCAIACYLAREGLSVTVVERDAIGARASGHALGLLNPANEPGPVWPLLDASFRMHRSLWPVLEEESGVDFQVRVMPHLEVALTDAEVPLLRQELQRWGGMDGFAARWLEPDDVLRMEPRLNPEARGAVLLEDVALLDSYRFTLALAQAAEHHGATFQTGEFLRLKTDGSRVTGVELNTGEASCDTVIVALGPWARRVEASLGMRIPIAPQRGQIIYLEGLQPPGRFHLHRQGPADSCSVVQKGDGLVWVAATRDESGFDERTTAEARALLMARGLKMVPGLEELGLVRQTACLRPLTPDEQPILGPVPGWDGVYLALGAGGKGILLAPAVARAATDVLTRGQTDLPVGAFTAERFL